MSRQIQMRRGTTAEHESFVGAVGEITMDTDARTLRVHDGETPGGVPLARADQISSGAGGISAGLPEEYDFIIESGGTSVAWYRKYKSGWVEQGGKATCSCSSSAAFTQVNLPVEMFDANYIVQMSFVDTGMANKGLSTQYNSETFFKIGAWQSSGSGTVYVHWLVSGQSAS